MKIAYFDCFAGISGDMTLGALIAVGADPVVLGERLHGLGVHGYKLEIERRVKGHIDATNVYVHVDQDHHHHHRRLGDILAIIDAAELSDYVKTTASDIFKRLAKAEAKVHGATVEDVHFHEVGAVDAIVDIVGSAICLEMIGCPKVVASPMPTFHGYATAAHGTFPLPAPATAEILQGVPWRQLGIEGELVTPTGAAIITTIAEEFGPMPAMCVSRVGYGSGKSELQIPNVLRVMIGEVAEDVPAPVKVSVIEANIDDLNPQFYDTVMERLFATGALDVYLSPIQMKKNRPATLLSVISAPEKVEALTDVILSETSSLGVRISSRDRVCIDRRWEIVETGYGEVRIKIGESGGRVLTASPEYDDCKRVSLEKGVPIKTIYDLAVSAYRKF